MTETDNIVIEQLRLIRAENADRDRQFMLVKAELATLRAEVQNSNTHLRAVLDVLSEHTAVLGQLSARLLELQFELLGKR